MAWTIRSHQHDFRLSIVGHFRPKFWAGQSLRPLAGEHALIGGVRRGAANRLEPVLVTGSRFPWWMP
jgi:hypothetical protein